MVPQEQDFCQGQITFCFLLVTLSSAQPGLEVLVKALFLQFTAAAGRDDLYKRCFKGNCYAVFQNNKAEHTEGNSSNMPVLCTPAKGFQCLDK